MKISQQRSSTRRVMVRALLVAVALGVLALVSLAAGTFRPDRQLAARLLMSPSPQFVSPVAPGDTIADRELGQPDFLYNGANFVDAQSMYSASGSPSVAFDQSSNPNHVYVADPGNNRVLGWSSVSALINGAAADIVIGQPDFFSAACNPPGRPAPPPSVILPVLRLTARGTCTWRTSTIIGYWSTTPRSPQPALRAAATLSPMTCSANPTVSLPTAAI